MRSRFDEQLALLNHELTQMGALCEDAISAAAQALNGGDERLMEKITAVDSEIDQKERDIESMCLKLLLHQQPVARDLRQISAALKMITDMERIGDQAADIAENIRYLNGRMDTAALTEMADATISMVTRSIDAYVRRDTGLAQRVIDYDDIVDALFLKVKSEVIRQIAADPEDGEYAIDRIMIAKYFERIGDHAVNIAEWVIFSVTGVHKEAGEA